MSSDSLYKQMKELRPSQDPILTAIYELEASQAEEFIMEYYLSLGKDGENRNRYGWYQNVSPSGMGVMEFAKKDMATVICLAETLRPEVIPKTRVWKEVLEEKLTIN